MEALINQARSKFRGTEEISSMRGRTPSFRENRPQRWFKRQFSRQMSSSQQSGEEAEYAAAVAAAAAAIAITSIEDELGQSETRNGPWIGYQPRSRSKIADISSSWGESGRDSKYHADQVQDSQNYENFEAPHAETENRVPEKTVRPVPSTKNTPSMPKKRLTFADQLPQEDPNLGSVGRTPSMKKTPTFREEEDDDNARVKPTSFRRKSSLKKTLTFDEEAPERRKPEYEAPFLPPPAIPPLNPQPAVPPKLETEIDAWERQEMAKIKERYENLNVTILEWEANKKNKAKRKLEAIESELHTRRAKAIHKYQTEMEQIKAIADGARAQAKDKRRNEELKVMEKANRYRETGQLPKTPGCLCW